jgi:PIN domain nuclease of toxin-antitoxin system
MRFLIDTHVWLWAVGEPERLRSSAVDLIVAAENSVVFSVASAWEIAIKVSRRRLHLPEAVDDYLLSRLRILSMTVLPVQLPHALRVAHLAHHHADPFDRLLIAQCQSEGLPLMTADAALAAYDVEILWAGRGRPPRRRRRATL